MTKEPIYVENAGEVSDGYHTFNQLYHQRAMLFAALVNLNKNISWKSLKHEDGKYCFDKNGDWFIVGIDTPEGTYTYHYETDKYWNIFNCQILPISKHWDGHTEEDVTRLLSLSPATELKAINMMRDTTPEERESIGKYINNIGKLTGVSFENLEQKSCDDCISRVLKRMWNCRGKWTLSIDKIAMEKIIREELSSAQTTTKHSVEFKEEGCEDRAEIYPICPNCKKDLDSEKWDFCPYCGIPIEKWIGFFRSRHNAKCNIRGK